MPIDVYLKLDGLDGEALESVLCEDLSDGSQALLETLLLHPDLLDGTASFTDLQVSSGGSDAVAESISLNFSKIEFEYKNYSAEQLFDFALEAESLLEGKGYDADFRIIETAQDTYMIFKMDPVLISSYQTGGPGADEVTVPTMPFSDVGDLII